MSEFKPSKAHDKGIADNYVTLVKKAKEAVGGQKAWDLFTEHIRHALINSEILSSLNMISNFASDEAFKGAFTAYYAIMIEHWGEDFK